MSFTLQTSEFEQALREYQSATKKDMSEVINRALRNVGFRAAEFTPKKAPEQIEAELRRDQIALKFITKRLRGRIGSTYQTARGNTRTVKRVTRKQIAMRTKQFIARRKKRTGFLRAGWVAALISAGIPARGAGKVLIGDSRSTLGSGQKATPQRLTAYLGNGVWGRLNGKSAAQTKGVMYRALRQAMAFVAADMKTYAREKMNPTARKFSARATSNESIGSQLARMGIR